MSDDLITKGLKNIVTGAATAGGVGQLLQYLERLDGRLAHLERTFTGTVGTWDQERFKSVQFSTSYNPFSDTVIMKWRPVFYVGPIVGGFYSLPVARKSRIVGCNVRQDSGAAGTHDITLRRGPNDLMAASVTPVTPSVSYMFPIPYPSDDGLPGASVPKDTSNFDLLGVIPAGESGVVILYFIEEVRP
jgi:hypothetical protein